MSCILDTDGYKFSMAEAGFPLREETFYYSQRKGGPHYLPFDVEREVRALLPTPADRAADAAFLDQAGYHLGGGFWAAVNLGGVVVRALPKGCWFFDREPVYSVTGPSALVSWLEPRLLQLHYRIQVATLALRDPARLAAAVRTVTCEEQRDLVLATLDGLKVKLDAPILVDAAGYRRCVRERVAALIAAVGGRAERVFEVGMRSVSCPEQHRLALEAAREAGLLATSNVGLARELGLRAVGTMGHEHVQRFGSDVAAFRAMRDRFPGPASFLLDTYSTLDSGLPTAFDLLAEDPRRRDFVRFDSGDKRSQFVYAVMKARARGITPRFILEDSFNLEMTQEFEALRSLLDVPAEDVIYGYGGHIVKAPDDPFTRDTVAAVYKLSQSGPYPTMKFGDEAGAGKESLPGRVMVYRPRLGSANYQGPTGMVAQEGELVSTELECLTGAGQLPRSFQFSVAEALAYAQRAPGLAHSPGTTQLIQELRAARIRSAHQGR